MGKGPSIQSFGSGLWHGLTGSAREILRKHPGQPAPVLAEKMLEATHLDCSCMPELSHWPTCRSVKSGDMSPQSIGHSAFDVCRRIDRIGAV
jgi:hypothetical protein